MKKLFALLLLTLGLIGFVAAEDQPTWQTPNPITHYLPALDATTTGAYIDLFSFTPNENGEFASEALTEAGIAQLISFTVDQTAPDVLNKCYAGANRSFNTQSSTDGLNTYPLIWTPISNLDETTPETPQQSAFSFLEKPINGLLLSATGIYMTFGTITEEDEQPIGPQIVGDTVGSDLADLHADYAIAIYPYDNLNSLLDIKKNGQNDLARLAICVDKDTKKPYFIVQYNYLVNDLEWDYQIKICDEGAFILVDELKTEKDLYFTIGIKRDKETILFGNKYSHATQPTDSKTFGYSAKDLKAHTFSFVPPIAQIQAIQAAYATATADIMVTTTGRAAMNGKSIIAFTSAIESPTINWPYENTNFQVGNVVGGLYPVVYRGNPTLTDDNTFSINLTELTPGKSSYLLLAYGEEKTNGKWNWTYFATSAQFTTLSITEPQGVTAGLPDGNTIPLTINPAEGNTTMMVVKSAWAQNIYPKGNLKEGDTYDNYKVEYGTSDELVNSGTVVAFLEPGTTSYNLPMTPGEAVYVHIYGVANAKTDEAAYAVNMVMTPVYLPATELPLSYTFSSKDYIESQPSGAMPILPPGISTSTVLPDDAAQAQHVLASAFQAFYPNSGQRETIYLLSETHETFFWNNVIAPEFSGTATVTATFKMRWLEPATGYNVNNHKPVAGDSVRIEYRLNGGAWQTAQLFTVGTFPDAEAGVYSLTAKFTCSETDVVNVRYSYYTKTQSIKNAIISYEFKDSRNCATPTGLEMVNDGSSDKVIALKWVDNNVPTTNNYLVSYQKAETDSWKTQKADKTETVLNDLDANTAYNVKVMAVCAEESSNETAAVRMSTAAGMPYVENMEFVFDYNLFNYSSKPDVSVYNGELGTELQEDDYMGSTTTWSIEYGKAYYIDGAEDPDALGVATDMENALLATPAIYVRKTGTPMPKTLTFRVNTYDRAVVNDQVISHNGIDLMDTDLRLYVLASTTGTFTWNDTVAAFDHNALKAENAAKDGERGMDLSVDLAELGGLVQFAFYFYNPNPFEYTDENAFPNYLELLGISFNYDNDCFPVENLEATDVDLTEATLTWEGEGEEYGITYYPTNDKAQAKTVRTEQTVLTLEGLTSNTAYTAEVISYCTKGAEEGSPAVTVEFKTLRAMFAVNVNISPEEAGTVTGIGSYFEGDNVTLTATANEGYKFLAWMDGETELSTEASYTFTITADVTYTAIFEPHTGIENLVKANFSVCAENGRLIIRNLNGIMIKDIDVYGLTGLRLHRFTPNSREDLTLPVKAERTLLFVRLNTETGVAVYKVYLY